MDVLPKHLQDSIISRIKILANIDISEKRRPQDGRISLEHAGKELDIRVSCLPSIYGESIVMRLLEKSAILLDLKKLGFYENDDRRFHSIIKKPNGIFLITGPTGSGKTTTLYAVINELNKTDTKIITAEDPVEYTLSGVNQGEVNDKIGYNFPTILRTMLRQDPNIIVVGEIRDTETADTAIAAALTGHLVLSTLHTNDAPSAIQDGPRTRSADGAIQVSTGPDLGWLAEARQRRLVRGVARRQPGALAEAEARHAVEHEPDWVSGACLIARRSALEAVSGFDERFFLYEEDADLCRRLRAAGWRVLFTPAAEVRHRLGQSMAKAPRRARLEYDRSHVLYYRKHNGPLASAALRLLLLGRGLDGWLRGLASADLDRRVGREDHLAHLAFIE